MAQNKDVAAMRMRIVRRGYEYVEIKQQRDGAYLVTAMEPLGGFGVRKIVQPDEVRYTMR